MNNILIDTCYWFALFDNRDSNHVKASSMMEYLEIGQLIIPFPTLYETLNTRFVNKPKWMESFENILNRDNIHYLDDSHYKNIALSLMISSPTRRERPMSLVDLIIRLILEDVDNRIQYLISFNKRDFIDLCNKKGIPLIDS